MSSPLTPRQRLLREVTEKEWSRQVENIARQFGWEGFHTYRSEKSPAGFPDWTFWRPGELIFVELKTMIGKLSPRQEEVITGMRGGGGRVYVWRPDDLEEVASVLSGRPAHLLAD